MSSSIRVIETSNYPGSSQLFTPEACDFLAHLHRRFNEKRKELLAKRADNQARFDSGEFPEFDPKTAHIRGGNWSVVAAPSDLNDRRVEITGPCDRKMMINALNSGAKIFMADLEDAQSPSWSNIIDGHLNLCMAVRRNIDFIAENQKEYRLQKDIATLVVRPRGWHLEEAHFIVDEQCSSASLFDFGLYFFHNAKELRTRGSGPYFYLPKLESRHEAALWNEVFSEAEAKLGLPKSSIRATVLIETITAAFQMEEILFELKEYAAGLNAGRWDYIFSIIKRLRKSSVVLPDRKQITMTVPFMKAYTDLLVKSCHNHGAHAIGGMAAYIPNRRDLAVSEKAIEAVIADKERESRDGFDGTWVAHPDLVSYALKVFDHRLGPSPHQKHVKRDDAKISAKDLLPSQLVGGRVSEAGVRTNIRVALEYIDKWLGGLGAVAIDNLMEDAATAEISRAQLWQWLHQKVSLDDGQKFSKDLYHQLKTEEENQLIQIGKLPVGAKASELVDRLVLDDGFEEFLTIPAYQELIKSHP